MVLRFFGRLSLMLLLLFFGVLYGIQLSNEGIRDVKGSDQSFNVPFSISDDHTEADVLGETVTTHTLEKKQQALQEIGAFNVFSSIGEQLSNMVTRLFRSITDALYSSLK